MCGINYDTLSEEEIRRINDILSDHKLKVNDHKECFHFVKYTIELNYRSNIGALLSLRSNYAMALEDENIRVYREADHLIIEKKRDHGPLFYLAMRERIGGVTCKEPRSFLVRMRMERICARMLPRPRTY